MRLDALKRLVAKHGCTMEHRRGESVTEFLIMAPAGHSFGDFHELVLVHYTGDPFETLDDVRASAADDLKVNAPGIVKCDADCEWCNDDA